MTEVSNDVKCCIMVVCGLPASGKTTLTKQIVQWLTVNQDYTPVVIKYDQLMPPDIENCLIQNQFEEKSLWKDYREDINSCVECFLNKTENYNKITSTGLIHRFSHMINSQINSDYRLNSTSQTVLIVDDNMYYNSMRYQYYQLARTYNAGFCEVYMECCLDTALQRNSMRPDAERVSCNVIKSMDEKFEVPDNMKQKWEKYSFNCTTENLDSVRPVILKMIQEAICDPVQGLEEIDTAITVESQHLCSVNKLHQADLILRQLISEKMTHARDSGGSKEVMKDLSKKLSSVKAEILSKIKNGQIISNIAEDVIKNSSKDRTSEFYVFIEQQFPVKWPPVLPVL